MAQVLLARFDFPGALYTYFSEKRETFTIYFFSRSYAEKKFARIMPLRAYKTAKSKAGRLAVLVAASISRPVAKVARKVQETGSAVVSRISPKRGYRRSDRVAAHDHEEESLHQVTLCMSSTVTGKRPAARAAQTAPARRARVDKAAAVQACEDTIEMCKNRSGRPRTYEENCLILTALSRKIKRFRFQMKRTSAPRDARAEVNKRIRPGHWQLG